MRHSARRSHQSVLQHYPQLLRNMCIGADHTSHVTLHTSHVTRHTSYVTGFATMWLMLSATTFEEKPEAPSIFADD
jgi:hypothetical protein